MLVISYSSGLLEIHHIVQPKIISLCFKKAKVILPLYILVTLLNFIPFIAPCLPQSVLQTDFLVFINDGEVKFVFLFLFYIGANERISFSLKENCISLVKYGTFFFCLSIEGHLDGAVF